MKFFGRTREKIPILTYHSLNVSTNSYAGNDHFAFESDLRTIAESGFEIVPLRRILDWYCDQIPYGTVSKCVAITLDDGSWLDYHDVIHPTCGVQTSMFNLLKEFRNSLPRSCQPSLHVSSFVIASPDARNELDLKNLQGNGWWGDDWWSEAQNSNLMSVESHSWDHAHYTLDNVAQRDNVKGDFRAVDTYADCTVQVKQSADYIEQTSGKRPAYFAYPWGQASEYLLNEYMPNHQNEHRFEAAFSIEPRHMTKKDNLWNLPRYVCGRDWKSPEELKAILNK